MFQKVEKSLKCISCDSSGSFNAFIYFGGKEYVPWKHENCIIWDSLWLHRDTIELYKSRCDTLLIVIRVLRSICCFNSYGSSKRGGKCIKLSFKSESGSLFVTLCFMLAIHYTASMTPSAKSGLTRDTLDKKKLQHRREKNRKNNFFKHNTAAVDVEPCWRISRTLYL